MCASASRITSSPRRVWASTAARLAIVPVGTNSAASFPRRAAAASSSRWTVGSSPITSSPRGAAAIAAYIAGVGNVTVSLRRSIAIASLQYWALSTQYFVKSGQVVVGWPARRRPSTSASSTRSAAWSAATAGSRWRSIAAARSSSTATAPGVSISASIAASKRARNSPSARGCVGSAVGRAPARLAAPAGWRAPTAAAAAQAADEVLGLGEVALLIGEVGAVMLAGQVEADGVGRVAGQQLAHQHEVAERLAHLLGADVHRADVHPEPHERA